MPAKLRPSCPFTDAAAAILQRPERPGRQFLCSPSLSFSADLVFLPARGLSFPDRRATAASSCMLETADPPVNPFVPERSGASRYDLLVHVAPIYVTRLVDDF